ncbi:MAG: hypothetical protein HC767_07540 [Akkermansiaceae bacterium]|nr:hypothetical protein [Akkermansiaceae bacterium]
MVRRNGIDKKDVASAVFSTTPDLNAEFPALETRSMTLWDDAIAASFHADHADIFITQKRMKKPDRVGSTTDAGDQQIWQTSFFF